jgi:hypothetical protein
MKISGIILIAGGTAALLWANQAKAAEGSPAEDGTLVPVGELTKDSTSSAGGAGGTLSMSPLGALDVSATGTVTATSTASAGAQQSSAAGSGMSPDSVSSSAGVTATNTPSAIQTPSMQTPASNATASAALGPAVPVYIPLRYSMGPTRLDGGR